MTGPKTIETTRRELFQGTGRMVAASALAGVAIPHVHAGEDNTIRLAIVGCGGRGTGAVGNALSVPGEQVKLIAMADLFRTASTARTSSSRTSSGPSWTYRPSGDSWASTRTARRSIACGRATSRS